MISKIPLRAENLRVHNKNLALSLIYRKRSMGISQSSVVEQTGLKAPTILRIFNELLDDGIIELASGETDETDNDGQVSKKGRKPVNFRVKSTAGYSISVDFWSAHLAVCVFDFWGNRIQNVFLQLKPHMTANDITDVIISIVKEMMVMLEISPEKIIGIGLAAPGQVDLEKNTITYYPRISGMKDYPIVQKLKDSLNIPVILHNNCAALATGEFYHGNFGVKKSLFTFILRSGVNGSFISNDEIFVNSHHQTIEIGHMQILPDGPECICGKRGCLESWLRSLDTTVDGMMFSTLSADSPNFFQTTKKVAEYLSIVCDMVSRILSPEAFLIVACNDTVASAISEHLQSILKKDLFMQNIPDVYHAGYDPLLIQLGINEYVIFDYFFGKR